MSELPKNGPTRIDAKDGVYVDCEQTRGKLVGAFVPSSVLEKLKAFARQRSKIKTRLQPFEERQKVMDRMQADDWDKLTEDDEECDHDQNRNT